MLAEGNSSASARIPYIGRARELEELSSGLAQASSGQGQLFIVSGEPGIGKTRLVEEFVRSADERGAQAVWGRCRESGGAPPYWPWVEILRGCHESTTFDARLLSPGWAHSLARLLPEFETAEQADSRAAPVGSASGAQVSPIGNSEAERFALFEGVASLLKALTASTPLILVLDDVHAADEASLLMLEAIARHVREMKVLLVITYREAEARFSPTLTDVLGTLAGEAATISLRGLDPLQVTEFVHFAWPSQTDLSTIRMLHDATSGNPFFLTEVVRLMVAEGNVKLKTPTLTNRLNVPHNVRAAVRRRLALVSESVRNLLEMAAVAGREFDFVTIRSASALPDAELLAALETATDWGLLLQVRGFITRYRFSHALICEALYHGLSGNSRKQYHLRIADAVAGLHQDDLEPHSADLAHHYIAALPLADSEKALEFSYRAGQSALRRLAYEQAVEFYEMAFRALEFSKSSDLPRRCELLLELGKAECRARLFDRYKKTFQEAAAIARRLKRMDLFAKAVLGYGMMLSDPNRSDPEVVLLLDEALAAVGMTDRLLRTSLLARLAEEIRWFEPDRAEQLIDEAVSIVREYQEPSTLMEVLYVKQHLIRRPDNAPERLDLNNETVRITETYRLDRWRFAAHYHRAVVLFELDKMDECRSEASLIRQLPEMLRVQNMGSEVIDSTFALIDGRIDESDRLARRALEIGRIRPDSTSRQLYEVQIVLVRREQGRLAEIQPLGQRSARSRAIPYIRAMLAQYYCETGRRKEAQEEFEELARDNFCSVPPDFRWFGAMACLAECCTYLDDRDRAEILFRMLEPYESRNAAVGVYGYHGPFSYHLAMLATAMKDYKEAEKYFRGAIQRCLRGGGRLWLARTRTEYAAMLIARGDLNDREKATELLDMATLDADRLGLKAVCDRATSVKAFLAGLTSRDGAPTPCEPESQGPATVARAEVRLFRKEGDFWTISKGQQVVRLKQMKGFDYIALLLRTPNEEIYALDLLAGGEGLLSEGNAMSVGEIVETGLQGNSDAGEMIDTTSKSAYRRRLAEITEALEEARDEGDEKRIDQIEEERDALTRELSRAIGLGGRVRRAASASERARVSVTRAIRVAIDRITEHDTETGGFFSLSIRTGTFCSYRPKSNVEIDWQL